MNVPSAHRPQSILKRLTSCPCFVDFWLGSESTRRYFHSLQKNIQASLILFHSFICIFVEDKCVKMMDEKNKPNGQSGQSNQNNQSTQTTQNTPKTPTNPTTPNSQPPHTFLPQHGHYRNLRVYQVTEIIYDITYYSPIVSCPRATVPLTRWCSRHARASRTLPRATRRQWHRARRR